MYKIQGHDANALYLYCLTQLQLCGKLTYHEYNNEDLSNLFGIIIVDIEVPPKYSNYFSKFPPIFVNLNVNVNEPNSLNGPIKKERKLVSVYKVEKIPLITPLLQWYLNHGLIITKIWGYIPANPLYIYKNFGDWVANERRKGKADNAFETKAECAKLIGNSAYGSTLLNKEKIQSTKLCNETEF